MPRISFLGRKWLFASDDLFYAGIIELIFNSSWLLGLISVFVIYHPASSSCDANQRLTAYFIMMISALSLSEICIILAICISARGTIMNESPRELAGPLLVFRGLVRLTELSFGIYGAVTTFSPVFIDTYATCDVYSPIVLVAARFSAILSLIVMIASFGAFAFVYDPLGQARLQGDTWLLQERARKIYRQRMNWCLALCARTKKADSVDRSRVEAFSSIAEYFAEYFESDDLVASDVLAGLILLRKQHRLAGLTTIRHARPPLAHVSDFSSPSNPHSLLEAHGLCQWPSSVASVTRVRASFNLSLPMHAMVSCSSSYNCTNGTASYNNRSALEWLDVRVMRRLLQLAASIYGWPYYSLKHKSSDVVTSLIPNLACCASKCCCCCCAKSSDGSGLDGGTQETELVGDNCCECNLTSFELDTGLRREHVLFASWLESGMHRVAFAVVVDHTLQSIIIVVRGTLSVGDVLTDIGVDLARITAPSDSFDDFLDAPNHHPFFQSSSVAPFVMDCDNDNGRENDDFNGNCDSLYNAQNENSEQSRQVYYVHSGILHATMRVRRCIEERRLLETAFSRYPSYNLVITGHSLGAGVSALLGWSYAATAQSRRRQLGVHMDPSDLSSSNSHEQVALNAALDRLVCYAFSPPGGLVSRGASLHLQRFVCSPFLGDDLVPRMSMLALEMLKNELLVVLHDCNVPKYRVIAKGCWQLCCHDATLRMPDFELTRTAEPAYQPVRNADSLSSNESDNPSLTTQDPASANKNNYRSSTLPSNYLLTAARQLAAARAQQQQHSMMARYPHMFAPGILVQFCPEYVLDERGRKQQVSYRLAIRQCDELERIVISSRMITHHLPIDMQTALDSLAQLVEDAEQSNVSSRNGIEI